VPPAAPAAAPAPPTAAAAPQQQQQQQQRQQQRQQQQLQQLQQQEEENQDAEYDEVEDPAAAPDPDGRCLTRSQLQSFYAARDPSKLPAVDSLLAGYGTAEILKALALKYGTAAGASSVKDYSSTPSKPVPVPVPQAPRLGRAQLAAFYREHGVPGKVAGVGGLLANYETKQIVTAMKAAYGAAPVPKFFVLRRASGAVGGAERSRIGSDPRRARRSGSGAGGTRENEGKVSKVRNDTRPQGVRQAGRQAGSSLREQRDHDKIIKYALFTFKTVGSWIACGVSAIPGRARRRSCRYVLQLHPRGRFHGCALTPVL